VNAKLSYTWLALILGSCTGMMSHEQQIVPPSKGSVNGFPHRKLDKEGSGTQSRINLVRSSSGGFTNSGKHHTLY
jgi:hypothetical protein